MPPALEGHTLQEARPTGKALQLQRTRERSRCATNSQVETDRVALGTLKSTVA
jgi:hypothetical protein